MHSMKLCSFHCTFNGFFFCYFINHSLRTDVEISNCHWVIFFGYVNYTSSSSMPFNNNSLFECIYGIKYSKHVRCLHYTYAIYIPVYVFSGSRKIAIRMLTKLKTSFDFTKHRAS